jgi:hypothetical protein
MNDPGATLVIPPRILECTERSQNGATYPDGIFAFGRGSNLTYQKKKKQKSPSDLKSKTEAQLKT